MGDGQGTDQYAPLVCRDKPFTVRQRERLSTQYGYGHRPLNDWQSGDLPAPFAEGDLLLMEDVGDNDRLRGMGPGYFVVSAAFSIDEGDAWYFRVRNNRDHGSDRLHVAWSERSTWPEDCNWMASFDLVETADPDGLEQRESMLAKGWTFAPSQQQRIESALQAAMAEGRNVLPGATDDQAHVIEAWAMAALGIQAAPSAQESAS